jgi:uncharacterized protein
MIYLDTTVFVYAAVHTGPKADRARELLRAIKSRAEVATSVMAVDELLWAVWKITGDRENAIDQAAALFRIGELQITPVTRSDSYQSLAAMRKYQHLRPRDALHLAVALRLGADAIVSDDKDFDGISEMPRQGLD